MVDATLGTGVSTQVGIDLVPWHLYLIEYLDAMVDAMLGKGVTTQVGLDLIPWHAYVT